MDVKGQLKDWLKATGKDIAKAVGAHIKQKGIEYAKDQLGLGLAREMHGEGMDKARTSASAPPRLCAAQSMFTSSSAASL